MIADMAAGAISMEFGLRGPNHCVVSACATGNDNIASARSLIQSGACDIAVTGGSEAPVCGVGVGGFAASRALSARNDDPGAASRPFDVDRDGFVIGEGAGALVLEAQEHAERRGARILAEVTGFGASADAYHLTAPHPEGLGARLALQAAIADSGIGLGEFDLINMHATSTPLGDVAESEAIRAVFTDEATMPTVTSTKSMTGHLLGAAGAIESIATVLSILHGIVPPTINLDKQDPACRVNVVANVAREMEVRHALSNAFGFGGHNTTVVLSRYVA
jgi:3-oxoacyl-[acyl-carrier-protein] synthase II